MTNLYVTKTNVTYDEYYGWVVEPIWSNGMGTRKTNSFSFGHDKQLADRFANGLEAGAVYENAHVATDHHNEQYVSYTVTILMRTADAELTRLGF